MILYPNSYFNKVSEISLEYLKENKIKGLILDVDNTLIDYYRNVSEDTIKWAKRMLQNDIKMCILSNSNKKDKIEEVASKLGIKQYSYFAKKPFKSGFKKVKKMLELNNHEIAVIGDQIFTDILGANRMNMHSILVEPIKEKDMLVTLIKRPIENRIKRKYLEEKSDNYNVRKCESINIKKKINIDYDIAKCVFDKKKKQRESREER